MDFSSLAKPALFKKLGIRESDIATEHSHEYNYKPIFRFDGNDIHWQFSTGNTVMGKGGTYTSYLGHVETTPYKGKYSVCVRISKYKNIHTNDDVSDRCIIDYEKFDTLEEAKTRMMKWLGIK